MKKYLLIALFSFFLTGFFNTNAIDEFKVDKKALLNLEKYFKAIDFSLEENKIEPEKIFEKKDYFKSLPILMFHYIRNVSTNSSDQLGYRLSFSPEKFEELLAYLKKDNIETLTFYDLKNISEGKGQLPEKSVILTFDDGYIDHYNAYLLLRKYKMKGVFFIITGKPDKDPNYLYWKQIEEMALNGQEIASHTVSHPDLDLLSAEQIKNELERSKNDIEAHINETVISFCYPSGKYEQRTIQIASKYYAFVRTTNPGESFSLDNRYELPALRILPNTDIFSIK